MSRKSSLSKPTKSVRQVLKRNILAEAKKLQLDIDPANGDEVDKILTYATPNDLVEKARQAMQ
jgi:hypothetical protein